MKISRKLSLFLAGVAVLFLALANALIEETHAVVDSYDELLKTPIKQSDLARVTQVEFKKQVQEWKDILLRGHDSDDLAKYTKQFHEEEARVRDNALALGGLVQDPEAKRLIGEFIAGHETLGRKYQEAYQMYVGSGFDFKAADKIVRGMDRPPTTLFDGVVARLTAQVEQSARAQRALASHKQMLALAITGGIFAVLAVASFGVVHNVASRLGHLKTISDKLANGDVAGLAIEIGGKDEIAEFGQSLKGIHTEIEDLAAARVAGSVGPC
jgi:methyl-accepting chemotaxis protein